MRRLVRFLIGTAFGRALSLSVLVGGTWIAWRVVPPRPAAEWRETTESAPAAFVELAPGGRRSLVRIAGNDGKVDLSLRNAETGRALFSTKSSYATTWAPNDEWLALRDRTGVLHIVDAEDGRERFAVPADDEDDGPLPYVSSPDGRFLAVARDAGHPRVEIRDAATGRVELTIDHAGGPIGFSPDGRILAALDAPDGSALKLRDVGDGRVVGEIPGRIREFAFSPDGRTLAAVTGGESGEFRMLMWDVPSARPRGPLPGRWGKEGEAIPHSPRFRVDGSQLTARVRYENIVWDLAMGGPETVVPSAHSFWNARNLRRINEPMCSADMTWDARGRPFATDDDIAISSDGAILALQHVSDGSSWLTRIAARFGLDLTGSRVAVFDESAGLFLGDLPESGKLLGFTADGRSLWAYSYDGDRDELSVRRWAVPSRRPPWWLLAATACAIMLVVADAIRSRRKSRCAASPAS